MTSPLPVRLNGNRTGLGVAPRIASGASLPGTRTPITGAPRRALPPVAIGGQPQTDSEVGSVFDFFGGGLHFPTDWDTRVWDFARPTPQDIDEMLRRDGNAASLDLVLSLPIMKAPKTIEPADPVYGTGASDDVLQYCHDLLFRPTAAGGMQTPTSQIIAQLTTGFGYKRCYFEKIYTRRDSRLYYGDIAWRPPASCTVRRDPKSGRLLGFSQQVPGEMIPAEISGLYSYIHINGLRRNAISGSCDLEPAFWGYITKQKVALLWFTYLESQSLPRIMASATSDDAAKELAQALAALKNNGVVGIPQSWIGKDGIKPLDVSGAGAGQFQQALQWIDSQSSLSVLAGFTDLPQAAVGGRGSNALSSDQSDFFMDLEAARADEISDSITNGILSSAVHLNFGADMYVPHFKIGPVSIESFQQQIQMLTTLANSPAPNVPNEFIVELVMAVAKAFNMDLDKINAQIDTFTKDLEAKAKNAEQAKLAPAVAAGAVGEQVSNNAIGQLASARGANATATNPSP